MWQHIESKVFKNVSAKNIWIIASDLNNWHLFNPGIEFSKILEPFIPGSYFWLKAKNGPLVQIQLIEVVPETKFVDCTTFFGAKMYGIHDILIEGDGVRLTTTIKITGPLWFVWKRLLGEKIAHKNAQQNEALVVLARKYGK